MENYSWLKKAFDRIIMQVDDTPPRIFLEGVEEEEEETPNPEPDHIQGPDPGPRLEIHDIVLTILDGVIENVVTLALNKNEMMEAEDEPLMGIITISLLSDTDESDEDDEDVQSSKVDSVKIERADLEYGDQDETHSQTESHESPVETSNTNPEQNPANQPEMTPDLDPVKHPVDPVPNLDPHPEERSVPASRQIVDHILFQLISKVVTRKLECQDRHDQIVGSAQLHVGGEERAKTQTNSLAQSMYHAVPCDAMTKGPCDATVKGPCDATTKSSSDAMTKGPCDATEKRPCDATAKGPSDATEKRPCDATTKDPCDPTTKGPYDATVKGPSDATEKSPCDATTKNPCDATTKDPCEATVKGPCDTTTKSPCKATAMKPSNASENEPSDASANESSDPSAKKPCDAPAKMILDEESVETVSIPSSPVKESNCDSDVEVIFPPDAHHDSTVPIKSKGRQNSPPASTDHPSKADVEKEIEKKLVLSSPAARKIAKISPYSDKSDSTKDVIPEASNKTFDKGSNVDGDGDDDDEIEIIEEKPKPSSTGLRLKSFSSLMASPQKNNNTNKNNGSVLQGAIQWHKILPFKETATAVPAKQVAATASTSQTQFQTQQVAATASTSQTPFQTQSDVMNPDFDHVTDELKNVFILNCSSGPQQKRYYIISSTSVVYMKLFVSETMKKKLPQDEKKWKKVPISFWPSRDKPSDVKITFGNKTIMAKLPIDHDATIAMVDSSEPAFILSYPRIKDLNEHCFKTLNKPFLSHALKPDGTVMGINLDSFPMPYFVELFAHLENLSELTLEVRLKTCGHIALALNHNNVNRISATSLEKIVHEKSKENPRVYLKLISRTVKAEIERTQTAQSAASSPSTSQSSAATQSPAAAVSPTAAPSTSQSPAATRAATRSATRSATGSAALSPAAAPSTSQSSAATRAATQSTAATPSTSQSPAATRAAALSPAAAPSTSQSPAAAPSTSQSTAATPNVAHSAVSQQAVVLSYVQSNTSSPSPSRQVAPSILGPHGPSSQLYGPLRTVGTIAQESFQGSQSGSLTDAFGSQQRSNNLPAAQMGIPSSNMLFCNLCDFSCLNRSLLCLHLSEVHFAIQIDKDLARDVELTCKFSSCDQSFDHRSQLVHHCGVMHSGVERHYTKFCQDIAPFGDLKGYEMKCPFSGCFKSVFNVTDLLRHLSLDHFLTVIRQETKNLQVALVLGQYQCPFDECRMILQNRDELVRHYGIDHCRVIDYVLPMMSPSKFRKLLEQYKISMGKDISFRCPLGKEDSCNSNFGSENNYLYHLSTEHFQEKLVSLFATRSVEVESSAESSSPPKRICNFCHLEFDHQIGSLHLGVKHCVANLILVAKQNQTKKQQANLNKSPAVVQSAATVPQSSNSVPTSGSNQDSPKVSTSRPSTSNVSVVLEKLTFEQNPKENVPPPKTPQKENILGGTSVKKNRAQPTIVLTPLTKRKLAESRKATATTTAAPSPLPKEASKPRPGPRCSKTELVPRQSGDDGAVAVSPEPDRAKKIFDDYLEFCNARKQSSKKCDVTWINVFLSTTKTRSSKEAGDISGAIAMISQHHDKLANGVPIDRHQLIENFKLKLNQNMSTTPSVSHQAPSRTATPSLNAEVVSPSTNVEVTHTAGFASTSGTSSTRKEVAQSSTTPSNRPEVSRQSSMASEVTCTTSIPSTKADAKLSTTKSSTRVEKKQSTTKSSSKIDLKSSTCASSTRAEPKSTTTASSTRAEPKSTTTASSTRSEPKSSSAQAVKSTPEAKETTHKSKHSSGDRSKSDPTDQYYCCNIKFYSLQSLMDHLQSVKHSEAKVKCRYCDESLVAQENPGWIQEVEMVLNLHSVGLVHLFNRWIYLNPKRSKEKKSNEKRRRSNLSQFSKKGRNVQCEACSKDITGKIQEHVTSKQHQDHVAIISNFSQFCHMRDINPVCCPVKDIIFYFDLVYPKTKLNKQNRLKVNIHQILMVLSRIHDPIDGTDVLSESTIEEHFSNLLSHAGDQIPVSQFICYACPIARTNFDLFYEHCENEAHKKLVKERKKSSAANVLYCEPCRKGFSSIYIMSLHIYSKEHQTARWLLENTVDDFPGVSMSKPDHYCHLCQVEAKDSSHAQKSDHARAQKLAETYFGFCKENNLHPVKSPPDQMKVFIKKFDEGKHLFLWFDQFHENGINELIRDSVEPERKKSATAGRSKSASTSSKISTPYPSLSDEEAERVTQCPMCKTRFPHATYMIYHVASDHKVLVEKFIQNFAVESGPMLPCQKCNLQTTSSMIYALHNDRHHRTVKCPHCNMTYISPSHLYREDSCRKNDISDRLKVQCEKMIDDAIRTCENPLSRPNSSLSKTPSKKTKSDDKRSGADDREKTEAKRAGVSKRRPSVLISDDDRSLAEFQKIKRVRTSTSEEPKPNLKRNRDESEEDEGLLKVPKKSKPNQTQSPTKSPSKKMMPLSKLAGKTGFCLDCDECEDSCNHLNHSRKFIADLKDHKLTYGHHRLQMSENFVSGCQVECEDLALSQTQGHRVRKQFKKYVRQADPSQIVWIFEKSKKCKRKNCDFETDSVIDLFRHFREHLPSGQ